MLDRGRRKLIALIGGAAAITSYASWPLAARAQQSPVPVIGILHLGTPEGSATLMAAFRQGLAEAGFVDGRNVALDHRWAYGNADRLRELADELVRRRVTLIVTPGNIIAALAAKAATTTIPIVFNTGTDPVEAGLVASLNKPGGNITGVSYMNEELGAKRLGILRELLPKSTRLGLIVNPSSPTTDAVVADLKAAATSVGCELEVATVVTGNDLVPAVASLVQKGIDAFLTKPDQLLYDRRTQLLTLLARYRLPAIYPSREWADAGGLVSYGSSFASNIARVEFMPAASSRARDRATCQSCARPNSSSSSTCKRPRRWRSIFPTHCSVAPTR